MTKLACIGSTGETVPREPDVTSTHERSVSVDTCRIGITVIKISYTLVNILTRGMRVLIASEPLVARTRIRPGQIGTRCIVATHVQVYRTLVNVGTLRHSATASVTRFAATQASLHIAIGIDVALSSAVSDLRGRIKSEA